MSEADVNSLLPGYHINQLREIWGKPDTSENSTACWKRGNDTTLVVSYATPSLVQSRTLKDMSRNGTLTENPSKPPLIDGLLYTGTYLFVGALKLGKSYLMAQLAYHISTGTPLWDYTVRKGTVLYLALEDDYRRLQERLYRMFGTDSTDSLQSRFWMSITRVFEREIQTYMCSLFICIWMKQHRIFTLTLYRLQQVASEV